MVNKIDADAPEYYCLAGILTDDEADVAIAAGLRHERTAEYLAKKTGRTLEETQKIAEHLAWIGIFRITTDPRDGKDRFFMLSSLDPVAVDQACIDLIYGSRDPGRDHFVERVESRHGVHTIEAAAALGFGSREYELVSID